MTERTITTTLAPEDWRDLLWLMDVLDEWLLYAEPATVRELERTLESLRSTTPATVVVRRLRELRTRIGERMLSKPRRVKSPD